MEQYCPHLEILTTFTNQSDSKNVNNNDTDQQRNEAVNDSVAKSFVKVCRYLSLF